MTNSEFLSAVYGELKNTYGWTTSFRSDPGEADVSAWAGQAWKGTPAQLSLIDKRTGDNNFFCVAEMQADVRPKRSKDTFVRLSVLLADDADPDQLLGQPSYIFETSPGNYQIGILLDPEDAETRDRDLIDRVLQHMVAHNMIKADASGNNLVRYGRLPVGSNTKKRSTGTFSLRSLKCDLTHKYSLEDAAAMFGLDLATVRGAPAKPKSDIPKSTSIDHVESFKNLVNPDPAQRSYHDSLLKLSASMVAAGTHPGAVVNLLRSLMLAVKPEDEHEFNRWEQRFGHDLIRMVSTAEKFAPPPRETEPSQFSYKFAELLEATRNIKWLVKGLVPDDSMGMIFGASGTFKSFIALDMAMHIATGADWANKRTKTGPVYYVAAEGGAGIAKRIQAWHEIHGLAEPIDNITICTRPVLLSDENEIKLLRNDIEAMSEKPRLVVIDTLAQTFTGDENSSSDIGDYIRLINSEIRAPFGCSVIIIHHTGHAASERPRGSSAITANLDFILGVFRPDPQAMTARLMVSKQKDGDKAPDALFNLERFVLGRDEDGDELSSLVAKYSDITENALEGFKGTKYTPIIMKHLSEGVATADELVIMAQEIVQEDKAVVRQGIRRGLTALSRAGMINERAGIWGLAKT